MNNGFIKVCAASPSLKVADTAYNANECIKLANEAGGHDNISAILLCTKDSEVTK